MPGEMASVINAMTNVTAVIVTNRNRFIIPPKTTESTTPERRRFHYSPNGLAFSGAGTLPAVYQMNGHGPPRTASTALGSPQASYAGRRSDSRIGRQSPLPPKPFNRQPSISTRRTRHPPEYSRPPDTTRCSPPIARSGTPRRTPLNLNISAIPRDRRDFRIRRILPISAPTPVIKNRGISNHSHGRSSRKKPNRTGFPHLAWEFRHRSQHPPNSPASPIDRPAMRGRGRAW